MASAGGEAMLPVWAGAEVLSPVELIFPADMGVEDMGEAPAAFGDDIGSAGLAGFPIPGAGCAGVAGMFPDAEGAGCPFTWATIEGHTCVRWSGVIA